MTYKQLKELDREEAIKMVTVMPKGYKLTTMDLNCFPDKSDVIVFGGNYWKSNDLTADFINEFIEPLIYTSN